MNRKRSSLKTSTVIMLRRCPEDVWASPVAQMAKNPPTMRETCVGKIPWRRKWQPIPVSLPGESHGQRSSVGYSPWGHQELGMIGRLSTQKMISNYYNYGTVLVPEWAQWCRLFLKEIALANPYNHNQNNK